MAVVRVPLRRGRERNAPSRLKARKNSEEMMRESKLH